MTIPLSDMEYGAAIKQKSLSKKRYYDDFRKQYFKNLRSTLKRKRLTNEQTKEIIKDIRKAKISNSRELNKAIDKKLFSGKGLINSINESKLNKTQKVRMLRLSESPLLGRPEIMKKVIQYHTGFNTLKSGILQNFETIKNYKQTSRKASQAIKKINLKSTKSGLKNGNTWKAAGRGTARGVAIIAVCYEAYRHTKFWGDFHRGLHTRKDAHIFIGRSSGLIAGAAGGAAPRRPTTGA